MAVWWGWRRSRKGPGVNGMVKVLDWMKPKSETPDPYFATPSCPA